MLGVSLGGSGDSAGGRSATGGGEFGKCRGELGIRLIPQQLVLAITRWQTARLMSDRGSDNRFQLRSNALLSTESWSALHFSSARD